MAKQGRIEMLLVVGWVCLFMSLLSSLILSPDAWAGMVFFGVVAAMLAVLQMRRDDP
ncbi:hypothetical protein JD969_14215 [Planctomycetota bacterium]|nr:hypothetical protein JD969_14215 [Planctomycetota bacterium]